MLFNFFSWFKFQSFSKPTRNGRVGETSKEVLASTPEAKRRAPKHAWQKENIPNLNGTVEPEPSIQDSCAQNPQWQINAAVQASFCVWCSFAGLDGGFYERSQEFTEIDERLNRLQDLMKKSELT